MPVLVPPPELGLKHPPTHHFSRTGTHVTSSGDPSLPAHPITLFQGTLALTTIDNYLACWIIWVLSDSDPRLDYNPMKQGTISLFSHVPSDGTLVLDKYLLN
jgi:hypothetical protein